MIEVKSYSLRLYSMFTHNAQTKTTLIKRITMRSTTTPCEMTLQPIYSPFAAHMQPI